jgi:hypothetical protein
MKMLPTNLNFKPHRNPNNKSKATFSRCRIIVSKFKNTTPALSTKLTTLLTYPVFGLTYYHPQHTQISSNSSTIAADNIRGKYIIHYAIGFTAFSAEYTLFNNCIFNLVYR